MSRLKLHKFVREEDASATVEFVLVFPVFMWFVLTIFETGFLATRIVMLERGLDIASRGLRLGSNVSLSHEAFKNEVCKYTAILDNCQRDMILEVVKLDVNSAYPQNAPNCIDRTGEIDPKIDFQPGARNEIMFVRACMIVDPLFPLHGLTLGLTKDASGGLQIVSYTAFMNEPS